MKCVVRIVLGAMYGVLFTAQVSSAQDSFGRDSSMATSPKAIVCSRSVDPKIRELHVTADLWKYFDKDCKNKPDVAAYAKWALAKNPNAPYFANDDARRRAANLPPLETVINLPGTSTTGAAKASGAWTSYFVLRDSFQDVSAFSDPNDASKASGASFGWTRDAVALNSSWSAKGVAAYPIVWHNPDPPPIPGSWIEPYLTAFALSPSVNFQRVTDSNRKLASNNVDVLTYSGTGEFAFANIFDQTTLHFFRTRTAAVGTFEGDTHSWSETLEYQPITGDPYSPLPYIGSPNQLGPLPARWQLDVIGRFQYLERTSTTKDPLFGRQDHLSRAGAVLNLSIFPFKGPESPVPKWLQRINLTSSYSWMQNITTNQSYALFDASVGFALDDAGNLGVKASYEEGKIEDTGKQVKLSKVTLSAKF
jgi:hypothetical protein